MLKKTLPLLFIASIFTFAQCSSDDKTTGGGGGSTCTASSCTCDALCKDANYTSGDEIDFGGGLVECTCAGSGDELAKNDCETYCDQFDVSASDSLLSSENSANDKCVCDGTTP